MSDMHLATGAAGRLVCEISFGGDATLVYRNAMRALGYNDDLVAYEKARALQPQWTVVPTHVTCSKCRVTSDWAFENAVRRKTKWFRFRRRDAERIARELGLKATKDPEHQRWGLRLEVFDGRSLSMRLQMAGRPFRRVEAP